jgi:hypothetical protein
MALILFARGTREAKRRASPLVRENDLIQPANNSP